MKTILTLVLMFLFTNLFSQTDYENAMKKGIDSLNGAKNLNDFIIVGNYFERIAQAENTKWLPAYYAAYCFIINSFHESASETKENNLLKAQQLIERMISINPDESEIYALQGMLYQAMISLDPQNNSQNYSVKADQSFEKSISLNEKNPRPYSLRAMNLMYTPEAYGGGMKSACPLFQKAGELFNNFHKSGELMPDWGKEYNAELLKKCK